MPSVCIVYPADPLGVLPSGIDTFIEGLIRFAPEDFDLRLIGLSTEPRERPVGRWTPCSLGRRSFEFYAVMAFKAGSGKPKIPVALRFMLGLLSKRLKIDADILEFHRIEPALLFLRDRRPKTCFVHQDMAELRNKHADIRWRHAPSLYFALERFLVPGLRSIFCIRESAVAAYRSQYPYYSDRFQFVPTWVDPSMFSPPSVELRRRLRRELTASVGWSEDAPLLVSVGRLDQQKDPLLMLDAFEQVIQRRPTARLIFVGDGTLRSALQRAIRRKRLTEVVALLGLRPKPEIADCLRAADLFLLSSAYEGMPMAVLESLGSGLPVVSTDVGEIRRLVKPGANGEIALRRDAAALAEAVERCLDRRHEYAGAACCDAVAEFSPSRVVGKIYRAYRLFLSG